MSEEQLQKGQRNLEIDMLTIVPHSGKGKDFQPFYTEIRIFESIFSPTLTADIVIRDPENLIEDMPIVGGETVHIKLRTTTFPDDPGSVIARSFQISAITQRTLDNDRQQIYTLKLVPPEFLRDTSVKLGKAFPGVDGDPNTAEIASKIFNDYMALESRFIPEGEENKVVIMGTPHSSSINYISNFWSPIQNINYICQKIQAADVTGSDYFFFESNKGYYITSLQHMIKEGLEGGFFEEYHYTPPSLEYKPRQDGNYNSPQLPTDMSRINELDIPRTLNIAEGNITGYLASNIQAYDMFNKKFKNFTLDMEEDFENYITTDKHLPVPKGLPKHFTAKTSTKILNSYGWNRTDQSQGINEDALKTHFSSDAVRAQYINSFNDYQFLISVPGRTDIEVGRSINFIYPKAQTKGTEEDYQEDEKLSGLYVVTEIKHRINPVDYSMTLRIVKNGVGKSLGGIDNG